MLVLAYEFFSKGNTTLKVAVVRQFYNNGESLQSIKELVKQIIEQRLMNHRQILLISTQSITESCRKVICIIQVYYLAF